MRHPYPDVVDVTLEQASRGTVELYYSPAHAALLPAYPPAYARRRRLPVRTAVVVALVVAWFAGVAVVGVQLFAAAESASAGSALVVVALVVVAVLALRRKPCPGVVVHCHPTRR